MPTEPGTQQLHSALRTSHSAFHCITCSDAALPARVLSVDAETGLALVAVAEATEEIDISLVEDVAPGDMLLVHGGVALAHLGAE